MAHTQGELVPAEEKVSPSVASDLVQVIERIALHPDADVTKLEKIIELQERILAFNARSAFNTAFSAMQGEIPAIVEHGKTNNGTYARLEDIIEKVRPILQKFGFTLSHRTEWPDTKTVRVIGILTHQQGHERTSEFLSAADTSGSKNAIQGLGSAVSYGRRYTVKDLLNIVTTEEDDDGQRSERPAEPEGYEDWLLTLSSAANRGLRHLTGEWNKSKKEFRDYVSRNDRQAWEAMKGRAAKVTP